MATVLDLHRTVKPPKTAGAPVEAYLNWIKMRRAQVPVDGVVLTEHRQWNGSADYRALEDKFGMMVLKAAEVETDYGHVLVFGVTDEMAKRFDFTNIRIPAQELVDEVSGWAVSRCHVIPGRPTSGCTSIT